MILEGSDESLSCVATVHAWRERLVRDIIVRVKIFHALGHLIIQPMCAGLEPPLSEIRVHLGVGAHDVSARSDFDWFGQYCICIVCI